MLKATRAILLLALLSLVLVACGGNDQPAGGDTSTGGGTVALAQTLETTDPESGATIKLNYPEGWVTNTEMGQIILASSQDLVSRMEASTEPDLRDGDEVVTVLVLPSILLSSESTLQDAFDIASMFLPEEGMGTPEEVTLGSNSALKASVDAEGITGNIFSVKVGDSFALVIQISNNVSDVSRVQAIIASMEITPAQ